MSKTKFFGARMDKETTEIIDKLSQEEKLDKTSAIKVLIHEGWYNLKLKKCLNEYRDGRMSVDKAAKLCGITVNEMMQAIAFHGIKAEETIEEYRKGIFLLEKNGNS